MVWMYIELRPKLCIELSTHETIVLFSSSRQNIYNTCCGIFLFQKCFWLKTQNIKLILSGAARTSNPHSFEWIAFFSLFYATLTGYLSTVSWNVMFNRTSNHSRAQNVPDCARGFHGRCPQVKFRADLFSNEVTPWLCWHSG